MKFYRYKTLRFILIYIVFSPFLLSCSYFPVSSRKIYNLNISEAPFDAIIVPGVPYDGKNWQISMKARVYWSWHLYSKGITKNIIYSGGAVYTPYKEAVIMSIYAQKLGVKEENILIEDKAEYSAENLYYSYALGKEKGFKKIALATDPFQSRKLLRYNKKFNLNIPLLPIIFDTLSEIPQTDPEINPDPAFVENFISVTKRYSMKEMRKGTTGKRIDSTAISE